MTAEKLSGRPCRRQQVPGTTSNYRLGTSSYTNVRSTVEHIVKQDKHVKESQTYANPDEYDNDTDATKDRCFGRQL
jgi:hypothetical protein